MNILRSSGKFLHQKISKPLPIYAPRVALLLDTRRRVHTSHAWCDEKKDGPGGSDGHVNDGETGKEVDTEEKGEKQGGNGGDGNHLRCPKCGSACTHVETFVCKYCWLPQIVLI